MSTARPLLDRENIVAPLNGDGPRVHRNDPVTSHEAADSNDTTASQQFVSDMLWLHGPLADHELVDLSEREFTYNPGQPRWSESRLRSARHELTSRGLVEDTGYYHLTPSGRRAKVWQVTR